MEYAQRRRIYEFKPYIKERAKEIAGYKCDRCGKREDECGRLEAHHIVPIYIARIVNCLSPTVIASLANCEVLCKCCHKQEHKQKLPAKSYIDQIHDLLAIDTKPMFPEYAFAGV